MANAKQCDICGGFYIRKEGWNLKEEYLLGKSTFSSTITYDLCDKCQEKLSAFVESMMKEKKHEP